MQAYIKTVIKEGKSEECFSNIVTCIDEINVEIKGYISQHKVCMYVCIDAYACGRRRDPPSCFKPTPML
jgi:hypothetical protein